MSDSKRVIKNTLYLYIRMGISILVNVFTTNILLKALGASDYGLYNVVGGAVAMLNFVSASMSSVTQRFLNYAEGVGDRDNSTKIFSNAKAIHYIIALFTVILLIGAGFIFFNGVLNIPQGRELPAIIVYVCLVFSIVFSITIAPYDAVLNAHENMLYYSILGIADVVIKLIIAIAILYAEGDRLIWYAILIAAESWLFRFITKSYCTKHYDEARECNIKKHIDNTIPIKNPEKMYVLSLWNEYYTESLLRYYSKCSNGYCYATDRSNDGSIKQYVKSTHPYSC